RRRARRRERGRTRLRDALQRHRRLAPVVARVRADRGDLQRRPRAIAPARRALEDERAHAAARDRDPQRGLRARERREAGELERLLRPRHDGEGCGSHRAPRRSASLRRSRQMMKKASLALLLVACTQAGPDGDQTTDNLTMGTKAWDAKAESEWSDFIARIGNAREAGRCTTGNTCLNDATINPLKAPGDADLNLLPDCPKLR